MKSALKETHRYDDIIHLPHHVSEKHPRMPVSDRAAQFSPFSALSGFEATIEETVRMTDERIELDDDQKAELDRKLRTLKEQLPQRPEVRIVYFVPDERKAGGMYRTVTGYVLKMDGISRSVVMASGTVIPMDDIWDVDGDLFRFLDDTR